MYHFRHIITALLLLFISSGAALAQVDTDFWFAVPYLVDAHDQSQAVGKGKLCLTSFADTAHVTITQPAVTDPNDPRYFAPMQYTLSPHSSVDIPVGQGSLNRAIQSGTCPFGLHIESDRAITVYYAQVNQNSEMYTLKGKNALGQSFLVGQQSTHGTAFTASPSIDIVATENNTQVTVQLLVNTFTGRTQRTLTVTLQQGEVYTVRGIDQSAANHLGGTLITSDKPVCVNTNDDSLAAAGQDLVGDQIVPEDLAGDAYIAIRNNASTEQLFLFTFPGRPITYTVNGGAQQTLAAASSTTITLTSATTYIEASDQFVCFQLTGEGGELGGTVLPRLDCTGSAEVAFRKRFTTEQVTLLVQTAYTGSFLVNGVPFTGTFQPVPNATGWSYCNITTVPFNASGVVRIRNTQHIFHAAILDYGNGTCSYGYFSGYNALSLRAKSDKSVYQQGETITFSIDDAALFTNVVWTIPDGTQYQGATFTLVATDESLSGTYTVTGESLDGCEVLLVDNSVTIAVETEVLPDPCPEVQYMSTEVTVCDTLLPYLWRGQSLTAAGDYHDTIRCKTPAHTDCDSICLTLHLTVDYCVPAVPEAKLSLMVVPAKHELCDGDEELLLEVQLLEGTPHEMDYTIACASQTVARGSEALDLPDFTQTGGHFFDVAIPLEDLFPNRYECTVTFRDTVNGLRAQLTPVGFTILYTPELIFAQKWDNVLAIFAPDYSDYGLSFETAYQWYRNGQPITGANASYYRLADDTFSLNDYYQVETTRLTDGVTLLTCPYYPHTPAYEQSVAPVIYNQMGQRVSDNRTPGFYIVVTDGQASKIIVR